MFALTMLFCCFPETLPMPREDPEGPVCLEDFHRFLYTPPGAKYRTIPLKEWTFMRDHTNQNLESRCQVIWLIHRKRITFPKGYGEEAWYTRRAWDLLDNVGAALDDKHYGLAIKNLELLRHHIGPEYYYAGVMPPTAAFHAVEEMLLQFGVK